MSSPNYTTSNLDHLGLVAGMCRELGLATKINEKIPQDLSQKHISYGDLVVAMILNGLGFVGRTLHMYPEYFETKPVERLLGEGIKAEHINDDALGRCLDALYEHNVSNIYQDLSEATVDYLGLEVKSTHLDSTSFHVDGEYQEEPCSQAVKLTKGYSRDHRPELNQVILNLITENQAGIPVYMQAANGNSNDSESFKQIIKSHIKSLKAAQESHYLVGDASLYVKETLQSLAEQGQLFVTRVPQKLKEAKRLIESQSLTKFEEMAEGYSGAWFEAEYGNIKQKWLLVRSKHARNREMKNLRKTLLKETEEAKKRFKQLCKIPYLCESDAINALKRWEKNQKHTNVSDINISKKGFYNKAGRPGKEQEPDGYQFFLNGSLYTSLEAYEKTKNQKGLFIIATNDCCSDLSMNELLSIYKSQQSVEKGFRFLKSPDFLTSAIFLKKPERVEALLMIMTCCLMVYAALEHQIRKNLKECDKEFPDQKKKGTQTPTARWVFFCFQGISELTINEKEKLVLNIKPRHLVILRVLGDVYEKIYS